MKRATLSLAIASFSALLSPSVHALADQASSTLIQNVRVFDGERMLPSRSVLIANGKIVDTNFKAKVKPSMYVVDGKGRTLLPGLIDAHVHAFQDQDLPLLYGVTTQIDMFTGVSLMQEMNKRMQNGENQKAADLISAGTLATAPGGHGTEYGMTIETLTKPEQAQAWVDARIAEGSYFIKIVMEAGGDYRAFNSLDLPTVKALIQAAHLRKKLAVIHISTFADARAALEAGADGLVHLFTGKEISDADLIQLVQIAKIKKAFVIPTFSVLESMAGVKEESEINDKHMSGLLNKAQLMPLQAPYGKQANPGILNAPQKLTAAFSKAQVPVLAGTDAGNSGTQYGISLHHELASLVQAGLTPTAALIAATSAPAKAFQLKDRGYIAKGYKADLLLVEGEPDTDITATRRIVEVWKDGETVSTARAEKVKLVAAQKLEKPAGIKLPADGRISLFSAEKLASPFGLGWVPTDDAPMGGKSSVELKLAENAPGGQASLLVKAKVSAGFAFPWAGIVLFPAAQPMQPVDLSSANTLKFRVKGDGKSYNAGFTVQGSFIPLNVRFVATNEWTEISIPFSQFKGLDPSIVVMLGFNAGPELGEYQMQIADVRLLKE
jgi:imidazolonepropionase-like amidohydrolase